MIHEKNLVKKETPWATYLFFGAMFVYLISAIITASGGKVTNAGLMVSLAMLHGIVGLLIRSRRRSREGGRSP